MKPNPAAGPMSSSFFLDLRCHSSRIIDRTRSSEDGILRYLQFNSNRSIPMTVVHSVLSKVSGCQGCIGLWNEMLARVIIVLYLSSPVCGWD